MNNSNSKINISQNFSQNSSLNRTFRSDIFVSKNYNSKNRQEILEVKHVFDDVQTSLSHESSLNFLNNK